VIIELLAIGAFYLIIINLLQFPIYSLKGIFIAGFFIHTLNWIFNANFWTVILFSFPQLTNPGELATCNYLNEMSLRLSKSSSVTALAIYGSISRQQWHDRSDVDIRFLRKEGLGNLILASFVTMRERTIAFINRQPMDLYLADDVTFLRKMRDDESPIFLIKRDHRLDNYFPDNKIIIIKSLR